MLLEQQEKLRRLVDEWRFRSRAALSELSSGSGPPSPAPSVPSGPVRLCVAPADPAGAGAASILLTPTAADDNVAVAKFVAVLSHSCIEISRLSDAVSSLEPAPILYCEFVMRGYMVLGWNGVTLVKPIPSFLTVVHEL